MRLFWLTTILPLTDDYWRNAPPSVIEGETGIPGPAIEEQRRQEHERNPYPSIPGEASSDEEKERE